MTYKNNKMVEADDRLYYYLSPYSVSHSVLNEFEL